MGFHSNLWGSKKLGTIFWLEGECEGVAWRFFTVGFSPTFFYRRNTECLETVLQRRKKASYVCEYVDQ